MGQHQLEHLQRVLATCRNLELADVVDAVTGLDQREEPAAVSAGTALHQHLGRIEMQVVERDHDGRETLRGLGVEVGLRVDQHAQSRDGTASRCEHYRSQTGGRNFDEVADGRLALRQIVHRSSRVDVRARRDQCSRHPAAIVRRRIHERRLALPLLDDVDLCTVLDE